MLVDLLLLRFVFAVEEGEELAAVAEGSAVTGADVLDRSPQLTATVAASPSGLVPIWITYTSIALCLLDAGGLATLGWRPGGGPLAVSGRGQLLQASAGGVHDVDVRMARDVASECDSLAVRGPRGLHSCHEPSRLCAVRVHDVDGLVPLAMCS